GDISPDGKSGGDLLLFDPRGCLPTMLAPYLRYVVAELHDAGKSIAFTPTAGQCVLFPGWLSHAVGVYNGTGPRISVAFNLDPIIEEFKDSRFNAPPKKREDKGRRMKLIVLLVALGVVVAMYATPSVYLSKRVGQSTQPNPTAYLGTPLQASATPDPSDLRTYPSAPIPNA